MENNKQQLDFDFDHWSSLARDDPEKFELMRQQLINEVMEQAPEHMKNRLEGLQWQVDQIRNQSDSSMAACITISQKMWDKVYGEKGLLDALNEPERILKSLKERSDNPNNVIPIKNYKATD